MRKRLILTLLTLLTLTGGVLAQDDERPFIGISLAADGSSGVLITQTIANAPADEAGLEVGDVIVSIDGVFVNGANLTDIIGEYSIGDTVELGILRDSETLYLDLTLGERPSEADVAASAPNVLERLESLDVPEPRARLGVAIDANPDGDGTVVINVADPGAAARAGIEMGDIITAVDDEPIENPAQLVDLIGTYDPGDLINVTLTRDDEELILEVTLGLAPPQINAPQPTNVLPVPGGIRYDADTSTWTVTGDELGEFGLEDGDVITEIGGKTIDNTLQMFDALNEALLNGSVMLTIERDDETVEIEAPVTVVTALLATLP